MLGANLKMLAKDDVRGRAHRCIDMMNKVSSEGWLGMPTKSLTMLYKDVCEDSIDGRDLHHDSDRIGNKRKFTTDEVK